MSNYIIGLGSRYLDFSLYLCAALLFNESARGMTIQYLSDLHLEFKGNADYLRRQDMKPAADVLVMAGDIMNLGHEADHRQFIDWAADNYERVIIVPGNHEYYGGFDLMTLGGSWEYRLAANVTYYQNRVLTIDDTDLILSTLWSEIPREGMRAIGFFLNDFHRIRLRGAPFTPDDYNRLHRECLSFIRKAVSESRARRRVVVTHHVPTRLCSPPKFKDSRFEAALLTDLTDYISGSPIDYWIYGHSHANISATIGGTHVVSNQLGYVFRGENDWNKFSLSKTISL